jgi:hypothetical protein
MRDDGDDGRGPRGDFHQGPPPPMSRSSTYRERGGPDGRPPMRPGFPAPPRARAEREDMREMEDFLFGPRNRGANVPPRPRADAGTPDHAAVGLPGDKRQADAS